MVKICPKCGIKADANAKFCKICGSKLIEKEEPTVDKATDFISEFGGETLKKLWEDIKAAFKHIGKEVEDEQDEEHGIVAELLHRQQFLEPDKGVEAEDHDARKHEQTAGLLVADGAVAHHQIDGVKGDQHKGHRHDQTAHDHVVGGHHQQGIRHQCRVHQPVLFGKAQRIVDLVDGNERDGCNDQIEDQRVEGEHDANEDDDAHNGCDNACFHRLALLCSAGRHSPLAGAAQPGERSGIPVPAPCTGYFGCSCCLTARQNGGCGD